MHNPQRKLKLIMVEADVAQVDIAAALNCSRQHISNVVNGQAKSKAVVRELAAQCGQSIETISKLIDEIYFQKQTELLKRLKDKAA